MSGFILGIKSEQNQTYDHNGVRVPTTYIKTVGCFMIDVKTSDKQGYFAVKLGLGQTSNIKKPVQGELNKAGIKTPLRFLKEIRLEKFGENVKLVDENGKKGIELNGVKIFVGDEVKPESIFKKDELVTVSGVSKGKGYQGVVKRHHFKGGSRTHGQSHGERAPGSIGMTTTPGRVFKGKRMAGRMGTDRVTVKNLKIIDIKEDGLVVKGLVAGFKGSLLEIKSS